MQEARLQRGKADGISRGAHLCVGQAEGQVPQGSRGRQQGLQLRLHLLNVQLHLQGAAVCACTRYNVGPRDWPAHRKPSELVLCTLNSITGRILWSASLRVSRRYYCTGWPSLEVKQSRLAHAQPELIPQATHSAYT